MTFRLDREIESKYEVLSLMGEGGMGAVYKVRHRYLDEIQVIKVVRDRFQGNEELRARFLREARTAKKLRHPNIAEVIDYSVTTEGTAFIVMEFIPGVNLREVMRRAGGALDPGFTIEVALQTLSALAYLHEKGFVHRDISADNLMLTESDGRRRIKLIDLGIAKSMTATSELTVDGKFIGKVQYASPEQFGGSDIDQRSDLYSLGVVLYEFLTGVVPISGSDYRSIIAGHLTRPPLPFDQTDPAGRVSGPLRTAVLKALEKDPDHRYPSANAFAATLQAIAVERTTAGVSVDPLLHPSELQTEQWDLTPVEISLPGVQVGEPTVPVQEAADGTTTVPESVRDRQTATEPAVAERTAVGRRTWAVAAVILLAAAALLLWRPWRSTHPEASSTVTVTAPSRTGVGPAGQLTIKGLPWGEIQSVTDGSGRNVAITKPLYTPAILRLPRGVYSVRLWNPNSGRAITLSARVEAGASNTYQATLDDVDAESYLRSVGAGR